MTADDVIHGCALRQDLYLLNPNHIYHCPDCKTLFVGLAAFQSAKAWQVVLHASIDFHFQHITS